MWSIDGLPVYEASIGGDEDGMMKISLVSSPAVSKEFVTMSKNEVKNCKAMYSITNGEKRLVRGVVMRADYPIYRRSENGREYWVVYTAVVIRQMAEKYLAEGRCNLVNLQHSGEDVEGVNMVQFFIKGDGVSVGEEFADIADGSLFAEFHITDPKIWEDVKAGTYKGFSLEGYFELSPEESGGYVEDIINKWGEFFEKHSRKLKNMVNFRKMAMSLAKMLAKFASVATDKGVLTWDTEEDLKAGDAVFIENTEGVREQATEGDYVTEDGKTIRVGADGKVVEIIDPEAEVKYGSIATDKGVLLREGEGDLVEGDAVFVEDENGNRVSAPDGEYRTEDGKVIVVVEGKVAEIRDDEAEVSGADENPTPEAEGNAEGRVEALEERVAELERRLGEVENILEQTVGVVEKLSTASQGEPAHEEYKRAAGNGEEKNPRLANLMRIVNAGK